MIKLKICVAGLRSTPIVGIIKYAVAGKHMTKTHESSVAVETSSTIQMMTCVVIEMSSREEILEMTVYAVALGFTIERRTGAVITSKHVCADLGTREIPPKTD